MGKDDGAKIVFAPHSDKNRANSSVYGTNCGARITDLQGQSRNTLKRQRRITRSLLIAFFLLNFVKHCGYVKLKERKDSYMA
ncbi:MAG TPA: hypothetical protein DEP42_05810 [Ruminococcaceae bacterium]|nr:hypothetical protein [Oscillospiraceae bacterium]